MNQKYPKHLRISKGQDFQQIFKKASRVQGYFLTLLYSPNDRAYPRLGFAISIKHAGSAVKRNYIKRVVREFFRVNLLEFESLDLIVLSRKKIRDATADDIKANLDYLKRKLNTKL